MNSQMVRQIFQAVQGGADPNQLIMQLAQNNPLFRNAMQIANGRTPEQIYGMATQMAQQRGIDLNQLARQLGVQLPK